MFPSTCLTARIQLIFLNQARIPVRYVCDFGNVGLLGLCMGSRGGWQHNNRWPNCISGISRMRRPSLASLVVGCICLHLDAASH